MKKEKIAIIGIGMIVPKAMNKDEFWQNVLDGRNCITEVPLSHWDSSLYYSPDRKAEDKTYTKIGGFIEGFQFNPLKYRIPPVTAKNISRLQQMTIEAVHEAMQDAGYDKKPFRTERTAAIFGNSLGPIQKDKNDFRVYRFKTADMLKKCPSFEGLPLALQDKIISEYFCKTGEIAAPINGDTLPGELANVIAGRIANVFNLNGPNFAADAACASSLAALDYAVSGLREHKFDAAITGGADDMVQPTAFVRFSKMGALSADGSFAFDERANGFVLAEAVSVYILKRLSDAERDGDKIYALIDAIGSSSDGKGKGIAAPNPKGQKLAIEHAFSQVEYTPGDIDFIEAHGTATKVGDAAEAQVLDEVFSPFLPEGKKIGLTSVKSQIGHSKSAAGAVSVAKTALALSKKVLPGSINCVKENPAINLEKFYVIKESSEWKKEEGLRRAAVSSFGFGGTNFHVLMEEYAGKEQDHFVGKEEPGPEGYFSPAMVKEDPCVPFDKLQPEAITIWGDTPADVIRAAQREAKEVFSRMPAQYPLAVYAQQSMIRPQKKFGVSIVAKSAHDFCDKAEILAKKANPDQWEAPLTQFKLKQIYPFITKQNKAKVGLLFPGQGSQSVNMLRDLAAKYRVVKETFDEADAIMMRMIGVKLTEAIWSKPGEDKAALQRREDAIRQTKLTQPAMMTADIAMYRLISEYGIKPDMAIGHSLGEYAAATAAGVFSFENGLRAVTDRAKEMSNINVADVGKMAFVAMGCDKVDAELAKLNSGYVVSANKNCPTQTVIAGETKAVIAAIAHFKAMGIEAGEIAVSHAFHSAIMAPAMDPYRSFLQKIPINLPSLPILSNVTSDFYPNDKQGIYDILVQQIASPVEFIKQLEHMYDLGVRTFIECGPKRVLTGFATATLKDKNDVTILASNHPKRGGIIEFGDMLANMTALGIPVNWNGKEPISGERHYNSYYRNWALANVAAGFAAGGRDAEPEQEKPAVPPETPKKPEGGNSGISKEQIDDLLNTVAALQEKIKNLSSQNAAHAEKSAEKAQILSKIEVIKEEKPAQTEKKAEKAEIKAEKPAAAAPAEQKKPENAAPMAEIPQKNAPKQELPAKKEDINTAKKSEAEITEEILALLIAKTGYPREMLELNADMEADLGIDTINQAEILALLREKYHLPADESVSVKDYPTIRHCIKYVFENQSVIPSGNAASEAEIPAKNVGEAEKQPEIKAEKTAEMPKPEEKPHEKAENTAAAAPAQLETVRLLTEEEITAQLIDLFAAQTGYPKEMLELDQDMEADLGIDTIKQAEILALLREKYKLPADNAGAIKDYPTIRHCIKFVLENQTGSPREHASHQHHDKTADSEKDSDPEPERPTAQEQNAAEPGSISDEASRKSAEDSAHDSSEEQSPETQKENNDVPGTDNPASGEGGISASDCDNNTYVNFSAGKEETSSPAEGENTPADKTDASEPGTDAAVSTDMPEKTAAADNGVIAVADSRKIDKKNEDAEKAAEGDLPEKTEGNTIIEKNASENDIYSKNEEKNENLKKEDKNLVSEKTDENLKIEKNATENNISEDSAEKTEIKKNGTENLISEKTEDKNYAAMLGDIDKTPKVAEKRHSARETASSGPEPLFQLIQEKEKTERLTKQAELNPDIPPIINLHKPRHIRYVPVLIPAPVKQENCLSLAYKRPFIIFAEDLELAKAFKAELSKRNAAAYIFTTKKSKIKGVVQYDNSSTLKMELAFRAFAGEHENIQGIIYLNGCVQKTLSQDTKPGTDVFHYAYPLFIALKVFKRVLESMSKGNSPFLAVVTTADGGFGYESKEPLDPIYGAIYGMSLCFRKEIPSALIKIIDFDPMTGNSDIASGTIKELLYSDSRAAISFRNGKRYAMIANPELLNKSDPIILQGKKVIITGAAGALGSVFARMLAEQYGAIPILIDRVPYEDAEEGLASLTEAEKTRWKNDTLYPSMKAADPDHKVTPAELENEYRKRISGAVLKRNINILKRIAPDSKYYLCDLLDADSFSGFVDSISKEIGHADGLVHFAGMEMSHRLEDKTSEEFARIFAIKATAAVTFWKNRRRIFKPGAFFAFASSIVGKFGNLGQCDYAAASAYISSLANSICKNGGKALSANMSAFDTAGMSMRSNAQKYLTECGVSFLHPEEGMQALLDEIAYGNDPEIFLTAELGSIDVDHQLFCNTGYTGTGSGELAMLPYISEYVRGHALTSLKNYSVSSDPYLADHKIKGLPYVPGVMGMESFAEAAYKMRGTMPAVLEDIKFSYPIKLFANKPEAEVILRANEFPDGTCRLNMESDFISKTGQKLRTFSHFSAAFSGKKFKTLWENTEKPDINAYKNIEADVMAIYDSFFQGPRLRVLEKIISCGRDNVLALAKKPRIPLWEEEKKLIFRPLVFESMFQACAWRDLKYRSMIFLPESIKNAAIYDKNEIPDNYYIYGRLAEEKENGASVYNAWAFDKDYNLIAELEGYEMMPAKEL